MQDLRRPPEGAGFDPILRAKEERWAKKLALAASFGASRPADPVSVAALGLRLPAALRTSGSYARQALSLHFSFRDELERRGIPLLYEEATAGGDGPESYFVAGAEAKELKLLALGWEAGHPWGELADLDVVDRGGRPLDRAELGRPPRPCLVCGGEAGPCVRERRHGLGELEDRVRAILGPSGKELGPEDLRIGGLALWATLAEAGLRPKPGLVGPDSPGAHDDMDYSSFLASAAALAPWFQEFARLGRLHDGEPAALLPALRSAGLEAEAAMFAATGGVNTHKGLIFSLGLLCAAAGRLGASAAQAAAPARGAWSLRPGVIGAAACAAWAAAAVRGICAAELGGHEFVAGDSAAAPARPQAAEPAGPRSGPTKGELLHARYGTRGVRGEAEDGFPSVLEISLPRLKSGLAAGLGRREALIDALLALFAAVEDTNVLGRAGPEGLAFLRAGAERILAAGGSAAPGGMAAVEELDRSLQKRRISPGGCADLLALSLFLDSLE